MQHEIEKSPTPALSTPDIQKLKDVLTLLREQGRKIDLDRTRLIVNCASDVIDALKLQYQTRQSKECYDSQQNQR